LISFRSFRSFPSHHNNKTILWENTSKRGNRQSKDKHLRKKITITTTIPIAPTVIILLLMKFFSTIAVRKVMQYHNVLERYNTGCSHPSVAHGNLADSASSNSSENEILCMAHTYYFDRDTIPVIHEHCNNDLSSEDQATCFMKTFQRSA
jgi:hypothetical protein